MKYSAYTCMQTKKTMLIKKRIIKIMGISFALLTPPVHATIGCLDNSYHLAQASDAKEYHFVQCNCPCIRRIAARNKCLECKHAHIPARLEIIGNTPQPLKLSHLSKTTPKKNDNYDKTANAQLASLIKKYRNKTK